MIAWITGTGEYPPNGDVQIGIGALVLLLMSGYLWLIIRAYRHDRATKLDACEVPGCGKAFADDAFVRLPMFENLSPTFTTVLHRDFFRGVYRICPDCYAQAEAPDAILMGYGGAEWYDGYPDTPNPCKSRYLWFTTALAKDIHE